MPALTHLLKHLLLYTSIIMCTCVVASLSKNFMIGMLSLPDWLVGAVPWVWRVTEGTLSEGSGVWTGTTGTQLRG